MHHIKNELVIKCDKCGSPSLRYQEDEGVWICSVCGYVTTSSDLNVYKMD